MQQNTKKKYSIKQLLKLIGNEYQLEIIMYMVEAGVIPTSPPESLQLFELPKNIKLLTFAQMFALCLAWELTKVGLEDHIINKILELPELHDCIRELQQHIEKKAVLVYGSELLSDDTLTHSSVCDYYCTVMTGTDVEKFYNLIARRAFLSHFVIDLGKIARAILNK